MEGMFALVIISVCLLHAKASLLIPSDVLSPLGAPESMGPAGLTAVRYAVGGRLLNMLGSVGLGSLGGLPYMIENDLSLGGLPGYPPITARSKDLSKRRGPNIPTSFNIRTATPTEVENFFAVLDKVDANKCISRLVCEVGSDPKVLEGLGHNIKDVMTSLQVLERNALSKKYKDIMVHGQAKGMRECRKSYSACDHKSYRLIKTFVKAFRIKN